ncbi:hypothetical protein [Prosthecobacter sp.]|uniref:hypothetical protein n=1 Tax=Prosthecobacter sp. TaxID=1965333 RepID=UPI003783174F
MPLTARHFIIHRLGGLTLLLLAVLTHAQEPAKASSSAIEGIKGVKQEAVESIKKIEPPTTTPVSPPTVQGVKTTVPPAPPPPPPPPANPVTPNTVQGVKPPPPPNTVQAPPPPPPPPANPITPNTVQGVKPPPPPNTVQSVPPPPATNAVTTIRAVKGVEGIAVPKQRNLEAALQIKAGTKPDPKNKAAAAALFGRPGKGPLPTEDGDGRAALQEFEKQTTPGS